MSKYDQYIKEFLLKNRELSAEKIGVFTLTGFSAEEKVIHPQFIGFQFNRKAETSDSLIAFIAGETSKSQILITSDLSSLFEDIRQYANLGKAYSFAGLGLLSLNRAGEYEFAAGQGNVPISEANHPGKKAADSNAAPKQTGKNLVILVAFLIILLVAGGIGWGIYKYINQRKTDTAQGNAQQNATDSTGTQPKVKDTTAQTGQQPVAANAATGDSTYYKFIFETTTNAARAYKRYDTLRSYRDPVLIDSVKSDTVVFYHLYVKQKLLVKDTAYFRDSLQKYFQRPIRIAHN